MLKDAGYLFIRLLDGKFEMIGGHDWDWTSDPLDVNEVLSRWATRPLDDILWIERNKALIRASFSQERVFYQKTDYKGNA